MAPFSNHSILHGLDQDDEKSIRRVMSALIRRVAGVTADAAAQLAQLHRSERGIVERIFNTAAGNELLTNMVERFGSAHTASSSTILQVAADFDQVATEAVQDPQARPAQELVKAQINFAQLIQSGRLMYYEDGVNEYGEFEESDSDEEEEKPETGVVLPVRSIPISAGTKRPLAEMACVAPRDDDSHDDNCGVESTAEDTKGGKKHYKSNTMKKNAPIRPQGTRCIDDGTQDREPAKLNSRDDSKLSMKFNLEMDDPDHPGRSISAGTATYTYYRAAEVDWTNKESVARLNSWRQGNFIRQIGAKQKARELWLESERDQLVQILEKHLSTEVVRGRWRRIDWLDIEGQYNAIMKGVQQKAGELTAKRLYNVGHASKNQKATSESVPIKKARTAPERSAQALRNQMEQFADDRARRLVQDAKKMDTEELIEDSDDENKLLDEISDWEVTSEDDAPEPKRQRKDKGKGKKVTTPVLKYFGEPTSIKEEKHSGGGEEEAGEESFARETDKVMSSTRKQNKNGKDGEDINGGSSSSSHPGSPSSSQAGLWSSST